MLGKWRLRAPSPGAFRSHKITMGGTKSFVTAQVCWHYVGIRHGCFPLCIPPHLTHFTSHLHPILCHQLTSHLTHLASPPHPLHTPHLPTPSHLTSPHLTPHLLTLSHPTSPQPHATSPQHPPTPHLLIPHLLTPSLPTSPYAPRSPGCGDEDLPLCLVPTRGAPIPIFHPPLPIARRRRAGGVPRERGGGGHTQRRRG